jgi:hypothetical protein
MSGLLSQREPGKANADQGQVLLDGPNGVAVSMTPNAAIETARSLLAAAEEAMKQLESGAGSAPHS